MRDSIWFHYKLTGGEPGATVRLTVKQIFSNGFTANVKEDEAWEVGRESGFGWYAGEFPFGATGTFKVEFYDESGNRIDQVSVRITS